MTTILSSTMRQIHLDIRKGSLPEFYGNSYRALKEDGIMIYQHGSPFFDEDESACRSMHRKVNQAFPISRVYQAHIPTSPAGYWLFDLHRKNTTLSKILTRKAGKNASFSQNTTLQTYTWELYVAQVCRRHFRRRGRKK